MTLDFKKWRTSKGLTQAQAAAATGIAKRTIEKWEAGETTPPAWAGYVLAAVNADLAPWPKRTRKGKVNG